MTSNPDDYQRVGLDVGRDLRLIFCAINQDWGNAKKAVLLGADINKLSPESQRCLNLSNDELKAIAKQALA